VSQRLGDLMDRDDVGNFSEQILELSRITGTDLQSNLDASTRLVQNFGLNGEDAGNAMNFLFRASQQSGKGFAEIADQVGQAGPVLRAAGLDFEQSTALVGSLAKAGVDASEVIPGLSKALATLTKEGKDPKEALTGLFDSIKNAPNDVKAGQEAIDLFGARSGPRLAQLIREGKLGYEDFLTSVQAGNETILDAADATNDFPEALTKLKNSLAVSLEPIATRVFSGMGVLIDRVVEGVTHLQRAFDEGGLSAVFDDLGGQIGEGLRALAPIIADAVKTYGPVVIGWVEDAIPPLLRKLEEFGGFLFDQIEKYAPVLADKAGALISSLIGWVTDSLPAFRENLGIWLHEGLHYLIDTGIPQFVDTLGKLGEQLVKWIGPQIPPLLEQLGLLLLAIGDFLLTDALPAIALALGKLGLALIEWVGPQIPPLLLELAKLGLALVDWIGTDLLPKAVAALAKLALKFLEWIATDVLPQLPGKLFDIWLAVNEFIYVTLIPLAAKALLDLTVAFLAWVGDVALQIPGKLGEVGTAILRWVVDAGPDLISYGAIAAAKLIEGIGHLAAQIPGALEDGIQAMAKWIADETSRLFQVGADIAHAILDGLKDTIERNAGNIISGIVSGGVTLIPGVPNIPLPGRAGGGPTAKGAAYLIGEDGPEVFVPDVNGVVLPNDVLGAIGSGSAPKSIPIALDFTEAQRQVDAFLAGLPDNVDVALTVTPRVSRFTDGRITGKAA
jgi:TP901 family phage tail tape measure protein